MPLPLTIRSRLSGAGSFLGENLRATFQMIPGSSGSLKGVGLVSAASITALLIERGLFIVDEEASIGVMMLSMLGFVYRVAKAPAIEYFEGEKKADIERFLGSYKQFSDGLTLAYEHNSLVKQAPEIMREFYQMERENEKMQLEEEQLRRRIEACNEVKGKLDLMVRMQDERERVERRQKYESLAAALREQIATKEFQHRFLQHNLSLLGNIKVNQIMR